VTYAARRIGAIADIVEINLDHIQILSPTVRFLKCLFQAPISRAYLMFIPTTCCELLQ